MIQIQEARAYEAWEVIEHSAFAQVPGAEATLKECLYRSSSSWIGLVDGKLACMWGLVPQTLLSNQAYLWLITTEIAAMHKFLLVRYSQMFIEKALMVYPVITGHVTAGNFSTKRWLRWLGAEFGHSDGKRLTFKIVRKG